MAYYTLTIFLSAFLLFALQPLMGKYLLPWFGGGAGIWTACMLFFQCVLLLGYSYAHLLSSHLSQLRQSRFHIAALALSVFLLPIAPDASWKPLTAASPTWEILLLLIVNVGVPFALLSATGPLLSRWFSCSFPARSPYRLYALSNAGSLLALLSYPFVIEPFLALPGQALLWSFGYGSFTLLCGYCAWRFGRLPDLPAIGNPSGNPSSNSPVVPESDSTPARTDKLLWLALAASASVMLLASTHQISQDLAVIPLLWVAPLAIYLLSFILCFDHDWWYKRWIFMPLLAAGSMAVIYVFAMESVVSNWIQIGIYSITLFASCMVCHGELVRLKPRASFLTEFYLIIGSGGAIGGIFVAVVAPLVFNDYFEYHLGLISTLLLAMICVRRHQLRMRTTSCDLVAEPEKISKRKTKKRQKQGSQKQSKLEVKTVFWKSPSLWAWSGVVALFLAIVVGLASDSGRDGEAQIVSSRSFFGVTHILQPNDSIRYMKHGRTIHGSQFLSRERRREPTTYYETDSGIGITLSVYRDLVDSARGVDSDQSQNSSTANTAPGLDIGLIGLGTGTLAALSQSGDSLRYYEIDANVERLAREYFTYLDDSEAQLNVILGDARILLEQEAQNGQLQQFDLLIVDAFNSDAIPMHLLTREAIELYLSHLKPQGLLVFHVTNQYLNLAAVIRGFAENTDHEAVRLYTTGPTRFSNWSDWVVLTRNSAFLKAETIRILASEWIDNTSLPIHWTDEYASLWSALMAKNNADRGKWGAAANFGRFALDEALLLNPSDLQNLRNLGRKLYYDSRGKNAIVLMTISERPVSNGKRITSPAYIERLYKNFALDENSKSAGILLLISVADDLAFVRFPKDWPEKLKQDLTRVASSMINEGVAVEDFSTRVVSAIEAMHSRVRNSDQWPE
jgi:hypothetical protein